MAVPLQPFLQKCQYFPPHGGGFHVPNLVAQQLPGLGGAGVGIGLFQCCVNAIQAGGRREVIVIPCQAQVRARGDEGIDLRGGEMLEQARHVVIDAVPVQPARRR